MKNILLVLSGPSGVGKGTIAKLLVERNKNLTLSVSCTTRNPRNGEVDGKDYFFIDKQSFLEKVSNNGFLEYSNHFENLYGTPRDFVESKLKTNDVLLEIDVNGGLNVKKNNEDAVLIMVVPPSVDEIKRRLLERNTECEEAINERMSRISYELEKSRFYDYTVVNDQLENAVTQIEKIIEDEKNK